MQCNFCYLTLQWIQLLQLNPGQVLIESTGVIGQRIKKVHSLCLLVSAVLQPKACMYLRSSNCCWAVSVSIAFNLHEKLCALSHAGGSSQVTSGFSKSVIIHCSGVILPNEFTIHLNPYLLINFLVPWQILLVPDDFLKHGCELPLLVKSIVIHCFYICWKVLLCLQGRFCCDCNNNHWSCEQKCCNWIWGVCHLLFVHMHLKII